MKKITFPLSVIISLLLFICSSTKPKKTEDELKLGNGISNAKLISNLGYTFTKLISDSNKIKRQTPEELILSFQSSNTLVWYNSLWLKTNNSYTQDELDKKIEFQKKGVKIEVTNLLFFTLENKQFCIAKFYNDIKNDTTHYSSSFIMQKNGNKWFFVTRGDVCEYYSTLFWIYKPDFIYDLLVNRTSKVDYLKPRINDSIVGDKFDIVKFIELLSTDMKIHKLELKPHIEKFL